MIFLGISEDLFDSGVTLCDESHILFASNEERYTRRKNEGGFPRHALESALQYTGIEPRDIGAICYSGHMTPPIVVRLFPKIHDWLFDAMRRREPTAFKRLLDVIMFATPVSHTSENSLMRRLAVPLLGPVSRRTLPRPLKGKPLSFVNHHHAHTAGAFSLSGFDEALCITADGMGDGLSTTVSRCSAAKGIERLWTAPSRTSFGLFFEELTGAFGFVPCRDEGKVTGLAACGDPARVDVPAVFAFENGHVVFKGMFGRKGAEWVRQVLLPKYSREDISAWAQMQLETCVTQIAAEWLRRTGLSRLVVSGGVFGNVKLNQRLHEIDGVEQLFVCPNMGDGGLSLGAIRALHPTPASPLQNAFLGEDYTDSYIEQGLRNAGLHYEAVSSEEQTVADLLAAGRIVARFQGRMEWGPRALGNRSILVRTTDRAVVDRLNALLSRSDFMPFAPVMLAEDAPEWLVDWRPAAHAAEFMTVCFKCSDRMRNEHPAVVHVDQTARAQLVVEHNNPTLHKILRMFKEKSGSSVILNTSFNIHEEPIVRTPEEAISTFTRAGLDYLSIGKFIVELPHTPTE